MSKNKREEQIADLTREISRHIESHALFDVPDGARYHTAANIIATDLMHCVISRTIEAMWEAPMSNDKRADEAEAERATLRARVAELEAALRRHTVRILTMPGETGDAIRGWSCSECNPGWFDSEDTIAHRDNCVFAALKGAPHEQESRC